MIKILTDIEIFKNLFLNQKKKDTKWKEEEDKKWNNLDKKDK